jgi:type I restriction enzyme S subunit
MAAWNTVKLSDVCEIQRGGSPRPIDKFITDDENGINWIKIGDVAEGAKYITETRERIKPEGVRSSREVGHGDFLLSNSMSFGRPYILRTSGCIHDGWLVLRYDKNKLTEDFLYHVLSSGFVYAQFVKFAVGAVVKNLNSEVVRQVLIPLPPISEQRRIAAILDQVDTLRAKRREALAQLDSLTQSIFIEMFGDPAHNSMGWVRKPLVSLCESTDDIKCGPFGTQLAKSEFTTEGIPLWGIKNVNASFKLPTHEFLAPRTAERLKQYSIEEGDIVMTRKGTVGNCAVYPKGFPFSIMHSDLLRLRVSREKCEPRFLTHQLHHSRDVERQLVLISGGAVMPGINVTKLKNLEVQVPPLSLQIEFSNRLDTLERLKVTHSSSLYELDTLFASLQHRAFRGEL